MESRGLADGKSKPTPSVNGSKQCKTQVLTMNMPAVLCMVVMQPSKNAMCHDPNNGQPIICCNALKSLFFLYRTVGVTVVVAGIVGCTQPQLPCNACVYIYIYHITSAKASIQSIQQMLTRSSP